MKASIDNPVYTVSAVANGVKYNLTPVLESITLTDRENQIAQSATIKISNQQIGNSWLSSLLEVRSRVYITADDGEKKEEVFRGFIWSRPYQSQNTGKMLTLRCYDHLIYFQESEESEFFASGKSTKDVISSLCSKWGVKLEYSYGSITHGKLALRGTLSDVMTDDVLELAKDRLGKKYVIRSEKDVVKVMYTGQNKLVYHIKAKQNAISTSSEVTMDGMVTKVVILGKENDDKRQPVEATVSGNTSKYGTLQKIIDRDEDTSLSDAKKEAQSILDEKGKPKWEATIVAVDIPWIRKGDKVKAAAGDLTQEYIVLGVDHDISNRSKTMSLTVEKVS